MGLIPSVPTLRPADILTSAALPGRLAALDIGVTSPEAAGAGDDCCEAMARRKRCDYQMHFAELDTAGVVYRPLVWSTFGREHPDTTVVLEALARQAARRQGLQSHAEVLRRTRAAVAAHLARRAVLMVRSCLGECSDDSSGPVSSAPLLRAVCVAEGGAEAAEVCELRERTGGGTGPPAASRSAAQGCAAHAMAACG